MPIEEDVEAFRLWATKLGCPPESMPDEDALKSVFKSRQRDLFCNMMRRVRPRQEIKDIKENILVHKVEKIRGQVLPISERCFLPQEMQLHLKIQDMKKKHKDVEQKLDELRKQYEALDASSKTKNIQLVNMNYKCELLESRVLLLEFKSKSLDAALEQEETNKEKISNTMPVILTNENKSEQKAMQAVQRALRELENFYTLSENNTNYQEIQKAKTLLWMNMRSIFANVPNFLIFNSILRLKEDQLQYIISLNKTIGNDSHLTGNGGREPLSNFEANILRTKASFLATVGKYVAACEEHKKIESEFLNTYQDFEDKLMDKMMIFNSGSDTEQGEEIMRNFMLQFNMLNFTKGKNEYLSEQIDILKLEIGNAQKNLENHEVLLGSIRQVYGDINSSVNRIQYEMMQLSQIRDKIIYSKNIMKHQLEELQATLGTAKSNFKPTKLKITNNNSMSLLGVESFEMSNDQVFCSTKLDFDSSLSSANRTTLRRSFGGGSGTGDITLFPQAQNSILPAHILELATFCETPMENLSCVARESSFYLAPNPLITESRGLSSTVQLAPGVLLTPMGALQEVRNRVAWADLIAQHSNDLKLNLDTFLVDPQQYKQRAKQQHDRVIEILDKIDLCSINTKHSLQKLAKFYDFLIENPLRHFIPPTKCFNNQSYADYEAELNMYIRMVTAGSSIK